MKLIGKIHTSASFSLALLVLRLAAGGLMIPHGYAKLERLMSGDHGFYNFLGIGELPSLILTVFAELLCALLVLLGLFTRAASVPLIITMAVAAFIVHAGDPMNEKELSHIYLACYLCVAILGPGAFSIDRFLKKA